MRMTGVSTVTGKSKPVSDSIVRFCKSCGHGDVGIGLNKLYDEKWRMQNQVATKA